MKILQKIFILLAFLFSFKIIFSQNQNSDSTSFSYFDDDKNNFFNSLHTIVKGNRPPTYFAVFPQYEPIERLIPLRKGEGYYTFGMEGSLDQYFTVLRGRSNDNYFFRTAALSLHYASMVRLTYSENDNYLLPTNQKIGFQFDKILWENYSGKNIFSSKNAKLNDAYFAGWQNSNVPLQMLYLSFSGIHYSNGLIISKIFLDSAQTRNDYQSGYFSTNYLQAQFIYSHFNKKLLTAGVGYQYDTKGIIAQIKRYGQQRITFLFQSRSKPQTAWFNLIKKYRTVKLKNESRKNNFEIKRLWEHRFRIEGEYILDDVSAFQRSHDYRLCAHFYYEIFPLRSKNVGFIFHAYYGRDYLNIRYDDVIFAFMGGFTLSLDKYLMPRLKITDYVQ